MNHLPYPVPPEIGPAYPVTIAQVPASPRSSLWSNGRAVALLFLIVIVVLRIIDPSPLRQIRAAGFDFIQRLAGTAERFDTVVIIDIDDQSLARLGQWPWPRTQLAELTRRLAALGARAIGYDILFAEEDRLSPVRAASVFEDIDAALALRIRSMPDYDAQFATAIAAAPVVIGQAGASSRPPPSVRGDPLSTVGTIGCDPRPMLVAYPGLIGPLPSLSGAASGQGLLNAMPESDGIVRRLPLIAAHDRTVLPSFVAEIVRVASGNHSISVYCSEVDGVTGVQIGAQVYTTDWDGSLWLNATPHRPVRSIPALTVLNGTVSRSEIAGRIVLVGSSAAGLGDYVSTSLGQSLPGIEVLSQAIGSMLAQTYPIRTNTLNTIDIAITFVLGAIIVAIFPAFQVGRSALIVAGLLVAVIASLIGLYIHGRYLFDLTFPVMTTILLSLLLMYLGHAKKEREIEGYSLLVRRRDTFIRCIIDNSIDGLVAVDEAGVILTANPAAAKMMNWPMDDLIGQPLQPRLFAGAQSCRETPSACCDVKDVLTRKSPCEFAVLQPDGSLRHVELAATDMQQDQSVIHIVTMRDITARRNAEIAARRSEQRLSDAVDSLHEGFAFWDRDGRLIMCNNRFLELLPVHERTIAGKSYEEVLQIMISQMPRDDRASGYPGPSNRFESLVEAHVSGRTVEIPLLDGRWVLASDRKMSDGGIVSLRTDITDLKLREIDLTNATVKIEQQAQDLKRLADDLSDALTAARTAQQKAEESSRAKSEFLAMMSHELRTPLNAIIGFSNIMMEGLFGPIENTRYSFYVKGIHDSGESLLNVINMILDLAKIESGKLDLWEEEIDLVPLIETCHSIVLRQAEASGVTLTLNTPPHMPQLRCDKRLVQVIVMNLVSNGVKFTPAGGQVAVTVETAVDAGLTILVTDTGIGIAPTDIERVLRPFEQGDSSLSRKYEGTGLGLPLAKIAAEKHGGTFELTSALGHGTRARVVFPEWPVCRGHGDPHDQKP